jgi:DNA-binding response OmpR family regulator
MLLGKHMRTKRKEERMRLLLVEDEEDLIQAMARGLRQEGYAVDLALDGLHGWELLATNAYDLLLLDLNLALEYERTQKQR